MLTILPFYCPIKYKFHLQYLTNADWFLPYLLQLTGTGNKPSIASFNRTRGVESRVQHLSRDTILRQLYHLQSLQPVTHRKFIPHLLDLLNRHFPSYSTSKLCMHTQLPPSWRNAQHILASLLSLLQTHNISLTIIIYKDWRVSLRM